MYFRLLTDSWDFKGAFKQNMFYSFFAPESHPQGTELHSAQDLKMCVNIKLMGQQDQAKSRPASYPKDDH